MKHIKVYDDYIKLLSKEIIKNDKKELTKKQISNFIKNYFLDIDYGFNAEDIRKDIRYIVYRNKYPHYNDLIRRDNCVFDANNSDYGIVTDKIVKDHNQYSELLKEYTLQNEDLALNRDQITQFVKKYRLDVDWNINEYYVLEDIRSIMRENRYRKHTKFMKDVFSRHHMKKKESGINNSVKKDKIKNISDIKNKNTITNEVVELDDNDKEISGKIYQVIENYPIIVTDNKTLKNMLADIIYDDKLKLNILRLLIDFDIIKDIKESEKLSISLKHKYIKKLTTDYGINENIASRMVIVWFHAYGEQYLHKEYN